MKRERLILLLILLTGLTVKAQQPEGLESVRMEPRANVITYYDENNIEKLRYDESPYFFPLDDWQQSADTSGIGYWLEYDFPKAWRDYRIFLIMQAPSGYGLWIGERLIGVSHENGSPVEFDITDQVRLGKTTLLSVRSGDDDDGALLDFDGGAGGLKTQVSSVKCALLLKPSLNIQDYTLQTQYSPMQRSGSYTVEADLHNHRKKGKCFFEVEIWDPRGQRVDKLGKWVYFDKRADLGQAISSTIADVQPWSAESPKLYTAVIRLYNEGMELEDLVGTRFGFRSLSMQENLFLNGKAITMRGVTMTPPPLADTPEAVQQLREELVEMKQHNINSIRTCGGLPAGERFYELCDELGFYVVVDANLFPRSTMGEAVAADVEYSDLFVERVRGMYGRLKNHPSIVAWSLGESADNGICMLNAYKALKRMDNQRPVLYSGAQYADNTDMIVPRGVNLDQLRQYLGKNQSRALLMLAYGSSEGNTFGGMKPLWKTVYDQPKLQGGFYRGGAWKELSGSPISQELKMLYSPVEINMVGTSIDQAEFEIVNRNDFQSLSDYKLEYIIYTNLKPCIVEGDVSVSVAPGESRTIKLKIPSLTLYADEELFIKFILRQRNNSVAPVSGVTYMPKNTLLYTCQFVLPSTQMDKHQLVDYSPMPLSIEEDSTGVVFIRNDKVSVRFDTRRGVLTGLSYEGEPLVIGPMELSFMRMPTSNDMVDPNGVRQWRRYNQNDATSEVLTSALHRVNDNDVSIDVMIRYQGGDESDLFDVRQTYLIMHTGDVLVSNEIDLSDQLKSIAKVGMQVPVANNLDTIEWFGRENESYPDRCASSAVAHRNLPVKDFAYPYQPVQESGNRMDTRWLAIRNDKIGLYADIVDTFCNFTLLPQRDSMGRPDTMMLNIDYRVSGIGGALGGMNMDELVLLKSHHYQFTVHLCPYDCREHDGRDFRQIIYPEPVSSVIEMPVISKDRERFDAPMLVTMVTSDPKAEIRYTLDGSVPTEQSNRYTTPITISNSTVVKARAFKKGESPSFVVTEQFVFDYVSSCTFGHKPNTPYNKYPSTTLIDGEYGDVNDLSRGWLGFSGHPVQVDLELGQSIRIGAVVARFAHVPDAWVFAPSKVQVSVSTDGVHYGDPVDAEITYDATMESMNTTQLQVLTVPIQNVEARFVRVVALPIPHIPSWHRAKGLNPWIMLDEIQVQEEIGEIEN